MPQIVSPQAKRTVGTLSPRELHRLETERAIIINVAPYCCLNSHTQAGFFEIEPRRMGQPYARKEVQGYVCYKDYGNDQYEPLAVEAEEIAEDYVRRALPGCFKLDEGQMEPSEEQLKNATEKMEAFLKDRIKRADEEWPKRHQPRDIDDIAKWGIEYFQMKREWGGQVKAHQVCAACQAVVIPGAILCAACKYPVDWQKAYEMVALTPEQEKRGLTAGLIVKKTAGEAA